MLKPTGLYDLLLTDSLARSLNDLSAERRTEEPVAPDALPGRLADWLREQFERLLTQLNEGESENVRAQLALLNQLLVHVRELNQEAAGLVDTVDDPPRVLRAIHPVGAELAMPTTGLTAPWLFTAGRGSPSLLAELRREAAACDRLDLLVSFITRSGVRKIIDVLRSATAAGAEGGGRTRIRVLTTTYTGATEIEALDELAGLNGCEVKISLDGRRTRLHAKAWIFQRASGFGSAYVGSANLSGAALLGGLEWTVKFTQRGQAPMFERALAHFNTLWLDQEFTPYAPKDVECRTAVIEALRREGGEGGGFTPIYFDIEPKPYQREMLEQLRQERAVGRNRSLLVAATGTGKTVVAALDYRQTCAQLGHRPRILFVAHRAQILRQALRTYREALRDHSFGELLTGGLKPTQHDYLFASIDSVTSRNLLDRFGPDYWHTVVIDECHRLTADRFDRLASCIAPTILLGLTATPERSDGRPILGYFSPRPDHTPAVELRLWDALDMQLLAPFEYYGCDDETDFSDVPWNAAGEVAAIERQVVGNDIRARMIVNEWRRLAGDPTKRRALVFCVSVAHARYMTEQLNAAGIPALCVTGDTPRVDQLRAPRMLTDGRVCALVTVDLYNEGVDLPDVDTLLLLRPTQSPVLFQQQIGRGLRLSPGKESCLILDFVGQHRADFRFDRLLATISGLNRRELVHAVKEGFSALPPGCHIELQRQSRDQVLRSLQSLVNQGWRRLVSELRAYAQLAGTQEVTLAGFVQGQRVPIGEIFRERDPAGWTTLKRAAQLLRGDAPAGEGQLSRRFGDLLHVDDAAYLETLRRAGKEPHALMQAAGEESLRLQMLTYQVDTSAQAMPSSAFLERLASLPECAKELCELAAMRLAQTRLERRPIPGIEAVPLTLHGAYRIREILTAFGYYTPEHRPPFQAGVLPLKHHKMELLFVTLDKTEGFHELIAYRDYAVSPSQFHWQTQHTAGPDTPAGRRYIDSPTNGWTFQLFVRVKKEDPYRACGPVRLASSDDISGDRPMSINWTLDVPLSPRLFAEFSVLRGQA